MGWKQQSRVQQRKSRERERIECSHTLATYHTCENDGVCDGVLDSLPSPSCCLFHNRNMYAASVSNWEEVVARQVQSHSRCESARQKTYIFVMWNFLLFASTKLYLNNLTSLKVLKIISFCCLESSGKLFKFFRCYYWLKCVLFASERRCAVCVYGSFACAKR